LTPNQYFQSHNSDWFDVIRELQLLESCPGKYQLNKPQ